MKAERPSRHKPMTEKDAVSSSEVGADEITECFPRLTICSSDSSKPLPNNVEEDKDRGVQKVSEESNGDDITVRLSKIAISSSDKSKPLPNNIEAVKEKVVKEEKQPEKNEDEEKKEPEGELMSRGPEAVVPKWKSQTLTSQSPYPRAVQINRTHGGCILFEQSSPPCPYLPEPCTTEKNYPNIVSDMRFTADYFKPTDTSIPTTVKEYPPVGASIPDEDNLIKLIKEITNNPEMKQTVLENITASLNEPIIDLGTSSVPQHIQEPCQVVPQRHPSSSSAYSVSSGSPPGPSSPNFYGNIPNFSPNVPSPQVNTYDETLMYSPTYCGTYQSPLQRPLSSCSSSSTNCSSTEFDNFDLNKIIRPTDSEKERQVVEELEKDLPNSSSDSIAYYMPPANCLGPVQTTNSPVFMVLVPENMQFAKKKVDGVTTGSSRTPRPILPKLSPAGPQKTTNLPEIRGWPQVTQSRTPPRQNTYPLPMQEQLMQRLDPEKKRRAWTQAMIPTDEEITKVDADGDSLLMILVCKAGILEKLEQLHAVVERYKKIPGALALRNHRKQSALYMACVLIYEEPLVAKYIAEALVDINSDMDIRNEEDGNTLIHHLCQDDKYSVLLDGLLSLKNKKGKCCFEINSRNYEGQSPLHVAVETHNSGVPCLEIVKVLLRHGADILTKDGKQGSTALHLALSTGASDKDLIQTLCNFGDSTTHQFVQGKQSNIRTDLVNAKNLKGDTPLHIVMAYLGLTQLQSQNRVIEILLEAGAVRAIRNNNGKVPLELAPEAHKAEIKRILDRYSAK